MHGQRASLLRLISLELYTDDLTKSRARGLVNKILLFPAQERQRSCVREV